MGQVLVALSFLAFSRYTAATATEGEDDPFGYKELWTLLSKHSPSSKLLPGLQAVASTSVCWSPTELFFRKDTVKDMCAALPTSVQLYEELPRAVKGRMGVTVPGNQTKTRLARFSLQKLFLGYSDLAYCWNIHAKASVDTSNFTRVGGLTPLLTEHHASTNIGHASRDASFLSFLAWHREVAGQAFPPLQHVLVKDHMYEHVLRQKRRVVQYRIDSLTSITQGLVTQDDISFIGDREANATLNRLRGAGAGVCFDLVVQRLRAWYHDHGHYRQKAWEYCGVAPDHPLDTILIEEHMKTRRWANRLEMVERIAAHPVAYGRRVLLAEFSNASFCEQVRVFAHSKVAILHHGAGLANCAFLSPEAVCVEVDGCAMFSGACKHTLGYTKFHQFFEVTGVRAVGARVGQAVREDKTKGKCPLMYHYEADCLVKVDKDGMATLLAGVYEAGGPWPAPESNTSLGIVDQNVSGHAVFQRFWPSKAAPTTTDVATTTTSAPVTTSVAAAHAGTPALRAPELSADMRGGSWYPAGNVLQGWEELLLVPAVSCLGQFVMVVWWACQRLRSRR